MLNLFGIKKTKQPVISYIPDVCMEPIDWHFKQLGIEDYQIISCYTPEIKKYPDRPKKIKNNPMDTSDDPYMNEDVCVLVSRFSQEDVNTRIIPYLYDKDWNEEDRRRGQESWERNFGKGTPFGDDPGALYFIE